MKVAVKKMIESNEALSKEVEEMRKEQISQVADRFFSNLQEQDGMQVVSAVMPRRADFVKDLAYNLRARARSSSLWWVSSMTASPT